jgi:hypothetical protein
VVKTHVLTVNSHNVLVASLLLTHVLQERRVVPCRWLTSVEPQLLAIPLLIEMRALQLLVVVQHQPQAHQPPQAHQLHPRPQRHQKNTERIRIKMLLLQAHPQPLRRPHPLQRPHQPPLVVVISARSVSRMPLMQSPSNKASVPSPLILHVPMAKTHVLMVNSHNVLVASLLLAHVLGERNVLHCHWLTRRALQLLVIHKQIAMRESKQHKPVNHKWINGYDDFLDLVLIRKIDYLLKKKEIL